jgi:hypothetical protein
MIGEINYYDGGVGLIKAGAAVVLIIVFGILFIIANIGSEIALMTATKKHNIANESIEDTPQRQFNRYNIIDIIVIYATALFPLFYLLISALITNTGAISLLAIPLILIPLIFAVLATRFKVLSIKAGKQKDGTVTPYLIFVIIMFVAMYISTGIGGAVAAIVGAVIMLLVMSLKKKFYKNHPEFKAAPKQKKEKTK